MADDLGSHLDSVELPSADEALTRSLYSDAWAEQNEDGPKVGWWAIAAYVRGDPVFLTGWCGTAEAAWHAAAARVRRERAKGKQ